MAASDKFMSDRMKMEFLDRKYGKQTPGMYRGTNFISGKQLDEERALANELALQNLKNTGQVDVARTTGEGYAEQQRLRNIGQRDVTGMTQTGLTDRAKMTDALGREKLIGDQYLGLRELEQNPLTPAGYSYIPGFQEYRQSQLGQTSTGERKYNSVTRDDGNVEYYDREGKLAYTDRPVRTTPNVPGSTLQSVGGQSPLPRTDSGTANQKTQTTNQRPSFLRDIRDFGSRIGQGFQQSAVGTRQRPLSGFDQESQYRKLLNRNY